MAQNVIKDHKNGAAAPCYENRPFQGNELFNDLENEGKPTRPKLKSTKRTLILVRNLYNPYQL